MTVLVPVLTVPEPPHAGQVLFDGVEGWLLDELPPEGVLPADAPLPDDELELAPAPLAEDPPDGFAVLVEGDPSDPLLVSEGLSDDGDGAA